MSEKLVEAMRVDPENALDIAERFKEDVIETGRRNNMMVIALKDHSYVLGMAMEPTKFAVVSCQNLSGVLELVGNGMWASLEAHFSKVFQRKIPLMAKRYENFRRTISLDDPQFEDVVRGFTVNILGFHIIPQEAALTLWKDGSFSLEMKRKDGGLISFDNLEELVNKLMGALMSEPEINNALQGLAERFDR
jgi:hypothetical protein